MWRRRTQHPDHIHTGEEARGRAGEAELLLLLLLLLCGLYPGHRQTQPRSSLGLFQPCTSAWIVVSARSVELNANVGSDELTSSSVFSARASSSGARREVSSDLG